MILFNLLNTLFSYLRTITGDYIYHHSKPELTRILYMKLRDIGVQDLEDPTINNQVVRVKDTIVTIRDHMDNIVTLISNVVNIITSAIIVFTIVPILIIPIIPIAIIYLIFDRKYRKVLYSYAFKNTENARLADANSYDLTDSKKLEEITINNAIDFVDNKYISFWRIYSNRLIGIVRTRVSGLYLNQLLYDLVTAFGYFFVFAKVINRTMSIGNATLAIRSLQLMQDSITDTVLVFNKTFEYSIKLKDAYNLFDYERTKPTRDVNMVKLINGPSVDIKNLSFSYPNSDKLIYKDFNLKIKNGEKIAIVGHNGAGKTTLVKLLANFYTPETGEILVNGQNLSNINLPSYYNNLGIMFQDYNTYPQMNVKENVIIGRPEISIDEKYIYECLAKADATKFVNNLPNKLETVLSEKYSNGVRPSTGQWQKIAIARFFYRNPSLVIFDEPTAAIDATSEYNIFKNIYNYFNNKTVIIISHRFSTVRTADRIIVIDQGRLVEQGSHTELMNLGGLYSKSFNLQAEGYK